MIKLIFILLIATAGGSITLILGGAKSGGEIFFLALGMIIAITCIILIYKAYALTQKMIYNGKS